MQGLARFAALFIVCLLTACGGGGSSSSPAPHTPPPATPPAPTADDPLTFDADNSVAAMQLGLTFAERAVQIVADALETFRNAHEVGEGVGLPCISGTADVTFDDVDADLSPSAGDTLRLQFNDCQRLLVNSTANGTVELSIERLVVEQVLGMLMEGTITFPGGYTNELGNSETYAVEGALAFAINSTMAGETLQISTPTDEHFTIALTGRTERVTNLQLNRVLDADVFDYQISFQGDIRSEDLTGSFDCVGTDITGDPESNPVSGDVECHGANNGQLRLVSGDANGGPMQLDADGSGAVTTLVEAQSWLELVEHKLLSDRTISFQWLFGRLPTLEVSASVPFAVIDVAASTSRSEIYVANTSGIVVLDAVSLQTKQTVALPDSPRVIEISEDQSQLYIGYTNDSVIQVLNLDDLSLAAPFDLGNGAGGEEAFAEDILSIGSNLVAVSMDRGWSGSHSGVAVFEGDVRRPAIASGIDSANSIVKTANGRLFGFNNQSSSHGVKELLVDASGVQNGEVMEKLVHVFGLHILAAGNRIVGSNGFVFSFDERELVGRLRPGQFNSTQLVTYFEPEGRFYALAEDSFTVFDGATLAPVSQFGFDWPADAVDILVFQDHVVVATVDELVLVDKASLTDYPLQPCDATPVSVFGSSSGAVGIECHFVDAVYEPNSGLVLAAVGPLAGSVGNSIAQINPQTGMVEKFIPLGYEPKRLALSASNGVLYAISELGNVLAALDLNTEQVTAEARLTSDSGSEPFIPTGLSASPLEESTVIVSSDEVVASMRVVSGGVTAPDTSNGSWIVRFDDEDGTVAYGLDFGDFFVYDIGTGGISQRSNSSKLLSGDEFEVSAGRVYTLAGERLNPDTLLVEQTFDAPGARLVGVDGVASRVLFFSGSALHFYDDASGADSGSYELPLGYYFFHPDQLLADPPDHIVLVDRYSMLIIPKSEAYAQ